MYNTSENRAKFRRAHRVLNMVLYLHKWGYQKICIAPGVSSDGKDWECAITHTRNIDRANGALISVDPYDGHIAHYSTANSNEYFGWQDGDEIIVSCVGFPTTINPIIQNNLVPVFVDIDPDTYNLSPDLIEQALSGMTAARREKVKALIPVHREGQWVDLGPIMEIARTRNLPVIEDAAQAIVAEYRVKIAWAMGSFGCFSFFPSKNLGAFVDGWIVTTGDSRRWETLCILRGHLQILRVRRMGF